jgi:hypothetical protein
VACGVEAGRLIEGKNGAIKDGCLMAERRGMTSLALSRDAMTVLGLAGTALPYAQSIDDEVERWLRPLRLYGESGAALQGLGVGEGRDETHSDTAPITMTPEETLHQVTTLATKHATERGAEVVGTQDILLAVMDHYGEAFERGLQGHAGDRTELLERLSA